jgi:hypothetical protein
MQNAVGPNSITDIQRRQKDPGAALGGGSAPGSSWETSQQQQATFHGEFTTSGFAALFCFAHFRHLRQIQEVPLDSSLVAGLIPAPMVRMAVNYLA